MCRLFGLSAGSQRVQATFWLLDAPDSLAAQSRREPHGTGLGIFSSGGTPHVDKHAVAAHEDEAFIREAKEVDSNVFIAHVRYATNGGVEAKNTHPFEQHNRLMAHNGVLEGIHLLEDWLGEYISLVEGETDSERLFALITKEIHENGGDVGAEITTAARWVASNLPMYSLDLVLITRNDLWALRYPDTNTLFVLERKFDGSRPQRHLEAASAAGTVRVRSGELVTVPSVLVASERMDENPDWRSLEPGELLHVGPDLTVTSEEAISESPAHQLGLEDLESPASASQKPISAN